MELIKEKEMPLLSRKRVVYESELKGATPSRLSMAKSVAKNAGVDQKLVIVKHIYPKYGSNKFKIIAHIYSDEALMKKIEHESLLKKHIGKEKPKAEAAAEPAAKEEVPAAEEKKEETSAKEEKSE